MQKKTPIIRSLARQGNAERLFERAVAAGEEAGKMRRGRLAPLVVRRVGVAVVGRRSLSLASALFALSASKTSDPIATGVAGAAIARSAVAKPVSSAKRVSNNRKNRPYSNSTRCI